MQKKPSEELNLPVIGHIWCQLVFIIEGKEVPQSVDEFDVVKVIENDRGYKIYVCDAWNGERMQIVGQNEVIKFESYEEAK